MNKVLSRIENEGNKAVQGQEYLVDYEPTKKEQKLIATLKSGVVRVEDIVKRAGVSPQTWTRAMRKPGFRAHLIGLGMDRWITAFPKIADKMTDQATSGQFNQQKYISDQLLGNQENQTNIQVNVTNYKDE
jgi:hypothetical protein